ncbi:WxcM-like domain-containing protein [Lunatimonas salinarum]|uniref:WxcM-like domain-containing protein n=1 Tax=Lunatimonas salinarum TaxID=1774590 RepID=UPI001ADF4F1A|nr:WxcM-like domain-containing protein [Lunatimonas salinarum]
MDTMKEEPILIAGGIHADGRGSLIYNNNLPQLGFDIKRFYVIEPTGMRGWHGHRNEGKLFTVVNGLVKILLVEPDDWSEPSFDLPVTEYVLSSNGDTLYVPGGYLTGMKCITESGSVLVCSDKTLEESLEDSYKFSPEYWYVESFF